MLLRTDHVSPNHDTRRLPISLVVLHYTGMITGGAALSRLDHKALSLAQARADSLFT